MGPFFQSRFFNGGFFRSLPGGGGKRKVIRRSQLAKEDYERELKALFSEMEIKPFEPLEQAAYDGDEDDVILLMVLSRVFH